VFNKTKQNKTKQNKATAYSRIASEELVVNADAKAEQSAISFSPRLQQVISMMKRHQKKQINALECFQRRVGSQGGCQHRNVAYSVGAKTA
jgi:hypothetical protein